MPARAASTQAASTNPMSWKMAPAPGLVGRVLRIATTLDRLYRERRYLAEMDAHMLRDIGLTPADIAREARRPIPWARLLLGRGGAL